MRFSKPVLFVAIAALSASSASGQTPAFPGAEGFGRFASGGRGGEVRIVTNLNDSGPGSLRDAVANRNAGVPRTVVFAVSGTIFLNSTLNISGSDLTIAGQTAPGDGICIARYTLNPSSSNNVIIRFIRSRLGDTAEVEDDAFRCRYATNVIVDHCSFSWSVDETASSYDNTNFTMQWCIVSESLNDSVHSKGPHGYGAIWGGLGATFHHNLIAHHNSRNPRFNGARTHGTDGELVEMRNNVIYNWSGNSTYGGEPTDTGLQARHNMVNNTYKSGPATGTGAIRHRILVPTENPASTGPTLSLFHISGNHTTASETVTADNWAGGVQVVDPSLYPVMRAETAFETPPIITQSAQDSFPLVLAYSGCRFPVRDAVDTRIVSEVQNGTATYLGSKGNQPGIIDSQTDVGGWPALASLPAPTDSDSDGMPDTWENARGLNPADPADRNITNAAGYTKLELYLNELAAAAFPIPVLEAQPESRTVDAGTDFSLSVTATGVGSLAYQWYHGLNTIDGATDASYSVTGASSTDAGEYAVAVTNDYGSVLSDVATIQLDSQPPAIITGPASMTAVVGQTVSFTVAASGSVPLACQWFRGTRPIPGATSMTLDLGPATNAAAGPYHVVVTNTFGSATSASAVLTVTTLTESDQFSTGFSADTIHAASPVIGPTATNWYVMSSKNATSTAVGDDPATSGTVDPRLDLTMVMTSSGIVETAGLFSETPVAVPEIGRTLRLRATLTTHNVRVLGLGLYQSGGSPPHTGLINSQLTGGSSSFATGGTQEWLGYRIFLDAGASAPAITLEGRPAQPGTSNSSQSLIVPGTSSSAPTIHPIASAAAPGFVWSDGAAYTLILDLSRIGGDALSLTATLHAGTNPSAPVVGVTSSTTSASTLPSALADSFDALAIGYRNRDGNSVSHVRVTRVSVQEITTTSVSDPYGAFLAAYQLDSATAGAPTADPESDGLANALEFVLGGNPKVADSSIRPELTAVGPGGNYRFLQHIDTNTVFDLAVERSDDLATWTPLLDGVDGVTITGTPFDDSHERIDVHLPDSPENQLFLRLSVVPKQGTVGAPDP